MSGELDAVTEVRDICETCAELFVCDECPELERCGWLLASASNPELERSHPDTIPCPPPSDCEVC